MADDLNVWWTANYGIPDRAAFNDATHPLWDAMFPVDPFGALEDTAQQFAALSPFGAMGSAAGTYLTLFPYVGTDQSTAAQAGINAAIRSGQGAQTELAMPQLIIPNCFQVTIQATAGGHVIDNVVGVQNASGTAAGAAAAVQTAWKVSGGPLSKLSSLYTLTGFRAVDISSSNGAIAQVTDTTAGGVTTGNALSTRASCALVQWNGGTRSRSSRGRLYLGPLMEANIDVDGANLVTGGATSLNGAITAFRSSLSGGGYPLVVLSRKLSQAFTVNSNAVEQLIATQRRRIR